MNKEDALEKVKQDYTDAADLLGSEFEAERMRSMIDGVISRYEQYLDAEDDIEEVL
jgi:hypothetical protein